MSGGGHAREPGVRSHGGCLFLATPSCCPEDFFLHTRDTVWPKWSRRETDADSALAASAAGLALHAVVLDDFKSYSGRVVAEFNSRGIIAIVGPNGAGKSCLVEGICFALGLDLRSMRAQNLKALVNRTGRDDGVACAVSCVFRARSGAGALCVQRRAIAPADGPARSEFRVQGCSCGGLGPGVEHDQLPWPCDQCEVRVARRSELKALLLRELQLDVDRPDTFVVQQSACASIAQQTPLELLCFIEDFARTAHLRRGVEADLFPPRFRDSAWQTHTASLPVSLLPIHRLCSFKIL